MHKQKYKNWMNLLKQVIFNKLSVIKLIVICSIVILFNSCGCIAPADFVKLDGFEILKKKRNYTSKENLLIEYHFLSHVKKSKKKFCFTYNKVKESDINSDNVLRDSTKVFCNEDLFFNLTTITKNTNLLDYQINQSSNPPSSINTNDKGIYGINLSQFTFNSSKNYIFKIQVQTNNKILNDTFQISINQ